MRLSNKVKQADNLFRLYLRKLWGSPYRIQCVLCQNWFQPEVIEVGHVISRSNYAVRWNEKNAVPLCRCCNQNESTTEKLIPFIPERDYEELCTLAGDPDFRLTETFIKSQTNQYAGS